MSIEEVRTAYRRRAAEYIDVLGSMDATANVDRTLIGAWAEAIDGRVIDVGCGPGHWTGWLHARGCDIEGIDPVPAFIDHAHEQHPGVPFRVGRADRLEVPDASIAGILAWYSLIHATPAGVDTALAEFARALRPGGHLAVGFFEDPELMAFDHAVTTAYVWPIGMLAERIEAAGFTVTSRHTRSDPGVRPHGALLARRR